MKTAIYILLLLSTVIAIQAHAQTDSVSSTFKFHTTALTIEPAIGIKPYPICDAVFSNVVQWDLNKKLSLVSYTSYSYNNALLRDFNYIKTNYNYSLSQKFGIGTSIHKGIVTHTLSAVAGIKYDAFKETLENPDFENVSMSESNASPDLGLIYHLKIGSKKYFFSYRMYLPLSPYPIITSDVNTIDGNFANVTLEFGLGIRIR